MATQIIEPTPEADQRQTAALSEPGAVRADVFAVLDHRLRGRAVSRAHAMPGHFLAMTDAVGGEHLLPLEDAIIHIGRAAAADLRFDDVHVSRRHAILVRAGDHVRVLDDRSSAGTFVNGTRAVATDLSDGDVIRLGPVSFTYVRIK
ncbi:MAG: FHA domain-containing protein [Solirubrobacterales bacterium]|nr:FHA domain-containing protein [Solirubrobacterales bacterium]